MSHFDPACALSWALSLGLHTLVCLGLGLSGWKPVPPVTPPHIEVETGAQALSALVLPSEPTGELPESPEPPEPLPIELLQELTLAQPPLPKPTPAPEMLLVAPEPPLFIAEANATPEPLPQATDEPASAKREPPLPPKTTPTPPKKTDKTGNAHSRATQPGSLGSYGAEGQPGILRNPTPPYPEAERQAGHEGVVRLRVLVEADGRPSRVELAASSGYPALDASALTTVRRQWRFQPARQAGRPVAQEIVLPVRFVLHPRTRIGM